MKKLFVLLCTLSLFATLSFTQDAPRDGSHTPTTEAPGPATHGAGHANDGTARSKHRHHHRHHHHSNHSSRSNDAPRQ